MNRYIIYLTAVTIFVSLTACRPLKNSKYTPYNAFEYTKEQPGFHFRNDSLKIEGEWYWATRSRAIPKINWLPKTPKRIIKSIANKNEDILFATWYPNRTKYSVDGFVPVTKRDARFVDDRNTPIYTVVLVRDNPAQIDTTQYKPKGKNNDYQFELYAKSPWHAKRNYWAMEVIAFNPQRCYNFITILDSSFVRNEEIRTSLQKLIIEDMRRFATQ